MSLKKLALLILALLFLATIVKTEITDSDDDDDDDDEEELSPMYELDAENFDETVNHHYLILVGFYAPWCGACKKWFPIMEELAEEYQGRMAFGKFNAWDDKAVEINKRYNVSGYPTLVFFKNGVASRFQKSITRENVVEAISKKFRHMITVLDSTPEAVNEYVSQHKMAVVGFFPEIESYDGQRYISEVAGSLYESFTLGIVSTQDPKVVSHFKLDTIPQVKIFKQWDEKVVSTTNVDPEFLKSWIESHRFPVLGQINVDNRQEYIESGVPLGFIYVQNDQQKEQLSTIIRPIAEQTRGKINWVFIDFNLYGAKSTNLGLSGKTSPAIAIEHLRDELAFPFPESNLLNANKISTFVHEFLDGKLEPFLKSAEKPEKNDGPVLTVVTSTFNEIVLNNEHDVLLETYAPWCGHCQKLAPIWEQLGETFKNSKHIKIAKIDGDANELHPKYGRSNSFPTVKLFKAGQKSTPIEFTAKDRTFESLVKFISDHTSFPAEVPKTQTSTTTTTQKPETVKQEL